MCGSCESVFAVVGMPTDRCARDRQHMVPAHGASNRVVQTHSRRSDLRHACTPELGQARPGLTGNACLYFYLYSCHMQAYSSSTACAEEAVEEMGSQSMVVTAATSAGTHAGAASAAALRADANTHDPHGGEDLGAIAEEAVEEEEGVAEEGVGSARKVGTAQRGRGTMHGGTDAAGDEGMDVSMDGAAGAHGDGGDDDVTQEPLSSQHADAYDRVKHYVMLREKVRPGGEALGLGWKAHAPQVASAFLEFSYSACTQCSQQGKAPTA